MPLAASPAAAPARPVFDGAPARSAAKKASERADRKQGDCCQAEPRVVADQIGHPLALRQRQELDHHSGGQQRRRNRPHETCVGEAAVWTADSERQAKKNSTRAGPSLWGNVKTRRTIYVRAPWWPNSDRPATVPRSSQKCHLTGVLARFINIITLSCALHIISVARSTRWSKHCE
jgi:hypothetical protein